MVSVESTIGADWSCEFIVNRLSTEGHIIQGILDTSHYLDCFPMREVLPPEKVIF